MKLLITPLLALTFTLGLAGGADASSHRRHHVRVYGSGHVVAHRYRNDDTIGGYYERRLDAVRFGSQRWWHIYDQQRGRR